MRMYDIIAKKRDGKELSKEEIEYFVDGYVKGNIPDYQVSSLLMAIYFKGMNPLETSNLTMSMAKSGEIIDLSSIPGIKVDKHSTGGVGDKTTLIISSMVASCGVPVAKMSGRSLGHTGGTIDKIESIPGISTTIDRDKFFDIVKEIGISIIGQSGNIVPADKKLYALRDVTATVESIPLIASSIMSKKIASGADCILLDVKAGSGAFMKNIDDALELAECMVSIGENVGRKTIALVTNMDKPLGNAIGNSLEIVEVCNVLKNNGPEDLTGICIDLAANMLYLANKGDLSVCYKLAKESLESGRAFSKFKEMIIAQGGDISVIENQNNFIKSNLREEVLSNKEGYIYSMDTEKCGIASMMLGAGRETKESTIDYNAGIVLNRKVGDYVKVGDKIATLYASTTDKISRGKDMLLDSINISKEKPNNMPIIYARVTNSCTEKY